MDGALLDALDGLVEPAAWRAVADYCWSPSRDGWAAIAWTRVGDGTTSLWGACVDRAGFAVASITLEEGWPSMPTPEQVLAALQATPRPR